MNTCLAVTWRIVLLTMLILPITPVIAADKPSEESKPVTPSTLNEDKDGVLWFEKGTDGQTALSRGGRLSVGWQGIVLVVYAGEKSKHAAIEQALAIREWLATNKKISVKIVANLIKKQGANYTYYVDGMRAFGPKNPKGIYSPDEVPTIGLRDAYITFKATDFEENAKDRQRRTEEQSSHQQSH